MTHSCRAIMTVMGQTDVAVYRYGVLSGPGDVNIWYIRSSDDTFLSRRLGRNGFLNSTYRCPPTMTGTGKPIWRLMI
ncbi:MAG: hypothetical protein WKF71_04965 [Pyrinomonadaceae bacterium]